jgi:hypothetical protein
VIDKFNKEQLRILCTRFGITQIGKTTLQIKEDIFFHVLMLLKLPPPSAERYRNTNVLPPQLVRPEVLRSIGDMSKDQFLEWYVLWKFFNL